MDEITRTNTTRILKFLQPYKLDFNEYSVWNYMRKKYHDLAHARSLVTEGIEYLNATGFIERVRRPGYYKLTEKGKYFISWDLETIEDAPMETTPPVQKGWRSWLPQSSSRAEQV